MEQRWAGGVDWPGGGNERKFLGSRMRCGDPGTDRCTKHLQQYHSAAAGACGGDGVGAGYAGGGGVVPAQAAPPPWHGRDGDQAQRCDAAPDGGPPGTGGGGAVLAPRPVLMAKDMICFKPRNAQRLS